MDGLASYITTSTGTRVHRRAHILRPELLSIGGGCVVHEGVVIHCFPRVSIGQSVVLHARATLRPPSPTEPLLIGDNVVVGPDCVVEARLLGTGVMLEAGCVVGPRCTLHDGVRVTCGSVVPPDTFAAPGTVLHGVPAVPLAVSHTG